MDSDQPPSPGIRQVSVLRVISSPHLPYASFFNCLPDHVIRSHGGDP